MAHIDKDGWKMAGHYARGIPLSAFGSLAFIFSVLKTLLPNPVVGPYCGEVLHLVPGMPFFYRLLPAIDLAAPFSQWGVAGAEMLLFLALALWGCWELEAGRRVRATLLQEGRMPFQDRV